MAARPSPEPLRPSWSLGTPPRRRDPFPLALLLALILHGALLFTIDWGEFSGRKERWLEVVLVEETVSSPPEEKTVRAQSHSDGGGDRIGKGSNSQRQSVPTSHHGPRDRSPNARQTFEKPLPRDRRGPPPIDLKTLQDQLQQIGRAIVLGEDRDLADRGIKPIRSLRAHRDVAAAYELAWQRKIEAVGSRHYPKEARNRTTTVLVSVWVREDGRVERIKILRSSGLEAVDRAVSRIVKLAAPFPPFPEELRREARILEITRLWRFEAGRLLGQE